MRHAPPLTRRLHLISAALGLYRFKVELDASLVAMRIVTADVNPSVCEVETGPHRFWRGQGKPPTLSRARARTSGCVVPIANDVA